MLSQVPRTQFLVSDFGECRLGHSRSFRFTWPHRVLELASPGLLLQSQPPYVCPYMSALICLPLYVCSSSYMCALEVYVCSYLFAMMCLLWQVCFDARASLCAFRWVLWHECPYVCPYASANCIHGDWNSRRSKRVWTAILVAFRSDAVYLCRSPMMMYFLGIVLQILYLSMFHMVVEGSTRTKSSYLWSLEPPAWYLTLHVVSLFVSDEA